MEEDIVSEDYEEVSRSSSKPPLPPPPNRRTLSDSSHSASQASQPTPNNLKFLKQHLQQPNQPSRPQFQHQQQQQSSGADFSSAFQRMQENVTNRSFTSNDNSYSENESGGNIIVSIIIRDSNALEVYNSNSEDLSNFESSLNSIIKNSAFSDVLDEPDEQPNNFSYQSFIPRSSSQQIQHQTRPTNQKDNKPTPAHPTTTTSRAPRPSSAPIRGASPSRKPPSPAPSYAKRAPTPTQKSVPSTSSPKMTTLFDARVHRHSTEKVLYCC